MGITDTDRINFIQKKLDESKYTGAIVLRDSDTGRGIRLHETSRSIGCKSVRQAIDKYMEENQ